MNSNNRGTPGVPSLLGGAVSLKQVALLLEVTLAIVEAKDCVAVLQDNFEEDMMTRGLTMAMEREREWELGCKHW